MFVPQQSDFIIDQIPDAAVSREPLIALDRVAQYRRNNSPEARVRVQGVVRTSVQASIFLHDDLAGLHVNAAKRTFAPGEIVEAIGFPVVETFFILCCRMPS